jgi:1-phosphofructokinase
LIYPVLLNPAIDVVYKLDELRLGETRLDVPADAYPSGKALNVAKAVRTLGEDATVVGVVPGDDEKQFKKYCDQLGVGAAFVTVEGSVRINTTITETSRQQVTHLNSASTVFPSAVQDAIAQMVQKKLSANDIWVFSGSIPEGFDTDIYKRLIQDCRKKKALAILDSRGKALKMGVRAKPEILKPNLQELEQYFGEQVQGVHHIALKAKKLVDLGIEYVFISLGSDGMIAVHGTDCLLCTPPQVPVADTVGAGDAMVAGIAVGMQRHYSFSDICRLAVACGTSRCMHAGSISLVREEAENLAGQVAIENA